MSKRLVSASIVREFLRSDAGQAALTAAGVSTKVGSRGKHNPAQVAVFHKANKGLRYEQASDAEKPTIEVSGVESIDKAGRVQRRTVRLTTEQARAVLGHPEGRRGRFAKSDLALALSAANANEVAASFK